MAQIAFDRRRINGPDESFPPIFEDDTTQGRGTIPRKRPATEIRPICLFVSLARVGTHLLEETVLRPGLINQANGSCYLETEKTKIACAMCVHLRSRNARFSFPVDTARDSPKILHTANADA